MYFWMKYGNDFLLSDLMFIWKNQQDCRNIQWTCHWHYGELYPDQQEQE